MIEAPGPRGGAGRQIPWPDLGLILLAVALAFPSLLYPFGRDQAAHAYIGWGWLHGMIPFRDAADQKPPGIYLLYTLGAILFGERQWGIRLLDLGGILLTGWLASRAASRGQPRPKGQLGAVILLTAGYYYVCFDYWNSAQTEIWQGLAVLAGVVILREAARPRLAALVTGVLGGVAVMFKSTAAVLCLGLAALLAVQAWRSGGTTRARLARVAGWGGLQILGGAAVIAAGAAYFAAFGALDAAVDLLVRYNLAYGSGWRTDPGAARAWSADFWIRNSGLCTSVFLVAWAWAVAAAWQRRDRSLPEILLMPAGLLGLGVVAVVVQGKFFSYHWGVLVPFLALAGAHGVAMCGRLYPRLLPWAAIGVALLGLLLAPQWICNRAAENPRPTTYLRLTGSAWRYLFGRIPRQTFLLPFDGGYRYRYADQEAIGTVIRDRARPGDYLLVRGFEPAVYTVSGLRCPSRFFMEVQLREQRVNFSREKWIQEYREARTTTPPRFVVLGAGRADRIGDLDANGYRRTAQCGRMVLYELGVADGPAVLP